MFVIQLLEKAGMTGEKSVGKNSFYDIKSEVALDGIGEHTIFYEIKYDLMSSKTGNLALEFFNPKSGKPSGIMITSSDFWIFCFNEPIEAWLCGVNALKAYIDANKPKRIVDVAGDKNASLMLYSREKLCAELFRRIDNMEKEEFRNIISAYINERGNNYINTTNVKEE
jgi:hypothetical protein